MDMKVNILKMGWSPEVSFFMAVGLLPFTAAPAWGQAGAPDTGYQPNPSYVVAAVAIQTDGKALIGGEFVEIQIARLQTNGDLDATLRCALSSSSYFRTLALQTDGKILVASDDGFDRLMPDGSRDTNFHRLSLRPSSTP